LRGPRFSNCCRPFKEAARELEADEDEKRWEERLKKVAKAKPEKPE
jgi:hypothetical protein